MKPSPTAVLSAAALVLSTAALTRLFAGPLNPPAGPVSSTYKTLTEVEPRTALTALNTPGDASTLFKITAPGSYYLAADAAPAPSQAAITIQTSHVTLDLNGYHLAGQSGATSGIVVSGVNNEIAIRRGAIRDFPSYAIDAANGSRVTLEDLDIENCPVLLADRCNLRRITVRTVANGYAVAAGTDCIMEDCRISNAAQAVTVGANSVVRACTIQGAANTGLNLAGSYCRVTGNRIRGGAGTSAAGTGILTVADGSDIEDNSVCFLDLGINVGAGFSNLVVHNSISSCNNPIVGGALAANLVGPLIYYANMGGATSTSNPHGNYWK
jgi:hypothetical protein